MMKRFFLVFLLLSFMASVANASWYWLGTEDNLWSNWNNWSDGTVSPPASDHTDTERINIPQGTVTADESDTMGYLHMSRELTPGNATVNLNSGATLNVSTGSSELVSVAYSDNVTNNLNVSNGRLNVWRGTGLGEIRLNHVYNATCVGNLNLSGTGIVDVEVLNKGERNGGGTFTGTGGTLIVRGEIDKFGKVSEGLGFFLGGSTLEVADWSNRLNPVGYIEIGNSQDTDLIMADDSTVVFDLGVSTNNGGVGGTDYDLIGSEGNFVLDGELQVNFLVAPDVGDYWDVWTVVYDMGSYAGSGAFDTLPAGIVASLVDVGNGQLDTLRLTYVPEPATVILLGLGSLIAVRRRKK
jgi:hypothetical protein